jgi:hypothetical protein
MTASSSAPALLAGLDFTSAPSRAKPIVLALGRWARPGALVRLDTLRRMPSCAEFEAWLAEPGPWLGAFDFPFGLPRDFVESLGLGDTALEVISEVQRRCATRMDFRALVDAWGNTQPPGRRLLPRAADAALAGMRPTSPLQTRYVPVGFMWFEGFSRLCRAGVALPGLDGVAVNHAAGARQALEGYPALVAHELIGHRSYKNEATPERLLARKDIADALEQGRWRGLRCKLSPAQYEALVADASGDSLDAVLCLMQAAWASTQPRHGMPEHVDALEGWIAAAPVAPATEGQAPKPRKAAAAPATPAAAPAAITR